MPLLSVASLRGSPCAPPLSFSWSSFVSILPLTYSFIILRCFSSPSRLFLHRFPFASNLFLLSILLGFVQFDVRPCLSLAYLSCSSLFGHCFSPIDATLISSLLPSSSLAFPACRISSLLRFPCIAIASPLHTLAPFLLAYP